MIQFLSLKLQDGRDFEYIVDGDARMSMLRHPAVLDPARRWLDLDCCRCPDCRLSRSAWPHCPVARLLAGYAADLKPDHMSEKVQLNTRDDSGHEQAFTDIPLQAAVNELVRHTVAWSSCPVGSRVRLALCGLAAFPDTQDALKSLALFFAWKDVIPPATEGTGPRPLLHQFRGMLDCLTRRLESATADEPLNLRLVLCGLAVLRTLVSPAFLDPAIAELRGPDS